MIDEALRELRKHEIEKARLDMENADQAWQKARLHKLNVFPNDPKRWQLTTAAEIARVSFARLRANYLRLLDKDDICW